jgi:hypothetical protein
VGEFPMKRPPFAFMARLTLLIDTNLIIRPTDDGVD